MLDRTVKGSPRLFVPLAVFALLLTGCAAKKGVSLLPAGGIDMRYRMPAGGELSYRMTNRYSQTMNVMGQEVKIESEERARYSLRSQGMSEGAHQLAVTIDTMSICLETPQGRMVPDLTPVVGSAFSMRVSDLGKEFDLTGADAISYEMPPGEKHSAVSGFQAVFPDLPGRPVEIGDTWESVDTIADSEPRGWVQMVFQSRNTFAGIDTVDGEVCAKITAEVTGVLEGEGRERGIDLATKGDIEARDEWYFSLAEGVFVKSISNGVAKTVTEGKAEQEFNIPGVRDFTIEMSLIR
jgi:hypothetical protein